MNEPIRLRRGRRSKDEKGKGHLSGTITLPRWWIDSLPDHISHVLIEEQPTGQLLLTPMYQRAMVPYIKEVKPKNED